MESRKSLAVGQPQPSRLRTQSFLWRRELTIAALFLLLAALFYAPLLFGVRAFPDGDFVHHFFPFSLYQHQQLAAGHLALWNAYTYGGHPFLADVQAALFYPISNFIYLVTLPVTDAAARFYWLQIEAVLHTALAGCFAYLWTRDLTGSRWGGFIGGVTFALSGYVTGYAPLQLAVLRTAVWLPLLLWCLGRGWQQPQQWRWWLGGSVVLSAAFLAGHSQSFMLLAYATAAWVLCLAVARRPMNPGVLAGTATIALLAIGLTAAQWMPSIEFVRYSVRANVDYAFVSGGLAWADFWQILLPGVLTQYSPLYIGVVGVALGVVALVSLQLPNPVVSTTGRTTLLPWKMGIWFCVGLAIFALLVSLGGNGPLYPLLYRVAPGWAWFRGQERDAFLVTIALCGLAAYGMAALPHFAVRLQRRAGVLAGAMVVGAVYAFGLLWQLQGQSTLDHASYLLVAGITLVIGLGAALLIALPGWTVRRSAWLVALAVVNLVWANAATNQVPGTPADRVRVAPEVVALIQAVGERSQAATGLPGRVYNEYRAYDDYGMRAGVEDVWGSSPLRVARYAQLFEQFPLDRMWRLLGVEHVLTWRRELFGPTQLLAEFAQATDSTYLHRLPDANPRAWLVAEVAVESDQRAWEYLADHQFDLDRRALVGPDAADFAAVENEPNGAAPAALGGVTMMRQSPEALAIAVQSEVDAFLVVSETWLPGWEVTNATCEAGTCPRQDEQGRRYLAPLRANLTLVGLWLPAGSTTFTLRYNPPSVRVGLWISAISLLLLAMAVLWRVATRASRP